MNTQTTTRDSPPIALLLVLLTVLVVGIGMYFSSERIWRSGASGVRDVTGTAVQRTGPSYVPQAEEDEQEEAEESEPEAESEEAAEEAENKEPDPIELAMRQPPGSLSGWVVSETGEYLEDAEVILRFENLVEDGHPGPDLKFTTGTRGRFEFPEVPPGRWTVLADHPGYSTGTVTGVIVQSDEETDRIEVIVPPAVELKGTVRTTSGIKLENARVRLFRQSLSVSRAEGQVLRRDTLYREVNTGNDGTFKIERAAPGPNVLVVSLPGFATERIALDIKRDGQESITVEMSLAASIGGVVRSSAGGAVAEAKIELRDPTDSSFKANTTSRRDGTFLITGLRSERVFRLTATAPNFAPSEPMDVPSGRLAVLVVMSAGGSISGTVSREDTGQPAAGIGVRLERADSGREFERLTRTSSEGIYRFTDLPGGVYNVRIVSEQLTSEPKLGVKVQVPRETANVNFSVYPGKTIRGVVMNAATRERIPRATITLGSRIGPEFLGSGNNRVTADEAGQFAATNLPYGIYTVEATADGYLRHPGPEATAEVELLPGEEPEPVTLLLAPGGVIRGVVYDAGGNPVEGARVQMFNTPGARAAKNRNWLNRFTEVSDSGGRFTMDGIPLDEEVNVTLSASATAARIPMDSDGNPRVGDIPRGRAKGKSQPITLTEFLSSADAVVNLVEGGDVRVTVSDQSGAKLEDVNLSLGHNGFPGDPNPDYWSARTNNNGQHVFVSIPPGGGWISASKDGYLGGGTSYAVDVGDMSDFEITLERATKISGYVTDDRGEPVMQGFVDAIAQSGARGGGRGQLDSRGRFEINSVSEGNFTLRAVTQRQMPTGRHEVWWESTGHPAGQGEANISVTMSGGIEGMILDAASGRPMNANVTIRGDYVFRENGARRRFQASTNTSNPLGAFSFQNIPPATYEVIISAGGFLGQTIEDVEVTSPSTVSVGTVSLQSGSTVRARIVSARTGEPIQGARLTLSPTNRHANSNAQGNLSIGALPEDIYSGRVTHGSYLPKEVHLIQVSRDNDTDIGVIELDSGGSLFGNVTDSNGRPVTSALVNVRYADEEYNRSARTNNGGNVTINGLTPGAVMVSVTGNFRRGSITKTFNENISARQTTRFDIVLHGELLLEGSISGPPGHSISGAKVDVYPMHGDGTPVMGGRIGTTIQNMRYRAEDLTEGRYLIAASGMVDGQLVHWTRTTIVNHPGGNAPVFAPDGMISGRITDPATGEPVKNLNVRLRGLTFPQSGIGGLRSFWEWTTTTNDDGVYRFRFLQAGEYEIVVSEQGSSQAVMDIISLPPRTRSITHNMRWDP